LFGFPPVSFTISKSLDIAVGLELLENWIYGPSSRSPSAFCLALDLLEYLVAMNRFAVEQVEYIMHEKAPGRAVRARHLGVDCTLLIW